MQVDAVVLGCGWAGILVSYMLSKRDLRVICIEKEKEPGGLLRSEVIDRFVIDTGGSHIIFSKESELLNIMLSLLGNEVISHERNTYIIVDGLTIPYPLENNLHVLPLEERYEALVTFIEALIQLENGWKPRNLKEWIYGFFGKWIAEKYLVLYNFKIWKRPLDEIDVDWIYVPGRLPIPDWRDVVKSAMGIPTEGFKEQANFYYPLKGGIYTLFKSVYNKALGRGVSIVTNYEVNNIKKHDKYFIVNNYIETKRIYSTIPLPTLIGSLSENIVKDIDTNPEEVEKLFDYNKIVTVAIALNKPAPRQHWVYVPSEKIVFHRYAWISNYSPYNAPRGKSLLLAEITVPKGMQPREDLIHGVISDFIELNVFKDHEIIFYKSWVYEHGYPLHKLGLAEIRAKLISELRKHGITLLGRWGSWRYLNMDMVLKDVLNTLKDQGITSLKILGD